MYVSVCMSVPQSRGSSLELDNTQTKRETETETHRQIEPYQGKDPWSKGVHASSPLTVGNCPLCTDDRLDHQGVDDGKEQHTGIQGSQHVGQPRLCGQLVSASHNEGMRVQDGPVYVQAWECNHTGRPCVQQMGTTWCEQRSTRAA